MHASRRTPRRTGTRLTLGTLGLIGVTLIGSGLPVGLTAAATAATSATSAPSATSTASYRRFSSCNAFLAYLRPEAERLTGPWGFNGVGGDVVIQRRSGATPMPAEAAPSADASAVASGAPAPNSSGTNTQEEGIDEGDLAENDGRYVYVATARSVQIVDTRAAASATRTANVVATIALPANASSTQLILAGRRLATITAAYTSAGPETAVGVYDVTDPTRPVFVRRQYLEGQSVSARSVQGRVRLVLQTDLGTRIAPRFARPVGGDQRSLEAAAAANRKIVRTAPARDWLPRTYAEAADGSTGAIGQALSCGEVGRPDEFSGLAITWIATVELDPATTRPVVDGSAGVIGSGSVVYASPDTLYVATTGWAQRFPMPLIAIDDSVSVGGPTAAVPGAAAPTARRSVVPAPRADQGPTTSIHAFSLGTADGARWIASGRVPGTLLNQFAMSEWNGVLRVATTESGAGFGGTTTSTVRTMDRSGSRLVTIAALGGLGRNEQIYAVRYIGDLGFVVTFRQTDPLYVVDLSNPRAPRLAGELKIPGYSSYLHPIGNGLLLGVGQDADANGRVLGTQLSVFDVNDVNQPKRLSQLTIGGSSEAETNHLAFLWWGPSRDAVLPWYAPSAPVVDSSGVRLPQVGAAVIRVGAASQPTLTQRGRITHPGPAGTGSAGRGPGGPISRSMIVDGGLVTVGADGLLVSDLTSLAPAAWTPWRA